jgi:pyridoxine kinase
MHKIVTVQDISCIGKCSCTAALPIISSYGIETVILPTALLSSHTDGFGENTFLDLTDEMKKIISHWKTLSLSFDGIYTGYLGKIEQLSLVYDFVSDFKRDKTIVLVDPVMGDGGKYYKYFSNDYLEKMKHLCSCADVITPNVTEACLLTDTEYSLEFTKELSQRLVSGLLALGAKKVVITGMHFGDDIGYVASDGEGMHTISFKHYKNTRFAGTGDVFASSLLSELLSGDRFFECVERAAHFTSGCIEATYKDGVNFYYGLNFEKYIKNQIEGGNA